MIGFEALSLEHKTLFDAIPQHCRSESSELSFTNMFMWRHKYHFHIAEIHGILWILNPSDSGVWYFSPPIGDYSQSIGESVRELQSRLKNADERALIIKKADSRETGFLSTLFPGEFHSEPVVADFDYLYRFADLKDLPGKLYHKKKNHVSQFLRAYPNWTYEAIGSSNLLECLECLEQWCAQHDCPSDTDLTWERSAIREAASNWSALDCDGGLLRIDGRVEAFTIAEKLNSETTVVHIEKASSEHVGLYPFINKTYLENCPNPTIYVNREQDMGIPGLRKAKESYHPIRMIEKHTLRWKDSGVSGGL